jgi:hypothetical protein
VEAAVVAAAAPMLSRLHHTTDKNCSAKHPLRLMAHGKHAPRVVLCVADTPAGH